jgi:hypothetical protein
VTFAEARRHLGVETQRQWSDRAVARTTPALLGLYSLVALWATSCTAARHPAARRRLVRQAGGDLQRRAGRGAAAIWARRGFARVRVRRRGGESAARVLDRLTDLACYAA